MTTPLEYCRRLTRASRSNFLYSFPFLPRSKREALYAVYAFSRHTDDLVDNPDPAGGTDPRAALAGWRTELNKMYDGFPSHPITTALLPHVLRYRLHQRPFSELIDGVEMDLTHARYGTFHDLQHYCHGVAGTVGLICLTIFLDGKEPDARQGGFAEDLGTAFQLTNIARDVARDARRNRIYWPRTDLDRFNCREADILAGTCTPAFVEMMRFQCARALDYYQRAWSAIRHKERRPLLPAAIMSAIYTRILVGIERAGYDVFHRQVTVPAPLKAVITLRVVLEALRERVGRD